MIWCQLFSTICHKSMLMLRQFKHLHTIVSRAVAILVTSKLLPAKSVYSDGFLVESPAAFAPSTCPGATDICHSLYSMEIPREWGAGYLTAVKLWESHHHPPNNVTKQLLITCVSPCWNRIQAVKVERHLGIQFSSSWYHQGCWQKCVLTIVQKPSQRTQKAEIPFSQQLVGFSY